MSDVDRVVAHLTSVPRSLDEVAGPEGIPAQPGLYAWWTRRGSIPEVPRGPHSTEPQLDLFYVGISPSRATSSATLRSRVTDNHMRGNTGGSTFRLTLASLLFEEEGWQPVMAGRPLLTKEDNNTLSQWQRDHLRLTWATHSEPWTIEHDVIARLAPPLNLAGSSHDFGTTVSAARRRFTEAAGSRQRSGAGPAVASPEKLSVVGPQRSRKLHEELIEILRESGNRWMATEELARAVRRRGRYKKRDGTSNVDRFQVHGRTKSDGRYTNLFERNGDRVRLRDDR